MSSNRQAALQGMLQDLKLTTMAASRAEFALKAAKEGVSHEAFLYELARLECQGRTRRRIERCLAQSGLPREKAFATFHLERLPTGTFVEKATDIVVVGPPEALGLGKMNL